MLEITENAVKKKDKLHNDLIHSPSEYLRLDLQMKKEVLHYIGNWTHTKIFFAVIPNTMCAKNNLQIVLRVSWTENPEH